MQETPQEIPPDQPDFMPSYAEGISRFQAIGCADCHVPSLPAKSSTFVPGAGFGRQATARPLSRGRHALRLGAGSQTGALDVRLFSDLKRHDLGEANAESRPDRGVAGNLFLTRPLWGIERSRPYLHDAHAPTLEDAILLHGGEAQKIALTPTPRWRTRSAPRSVFS